MLKTIIVIVVVIVFIFLIILKEFFPTVYIVHIKWKYREFCKYINDIFK